MNITLLRVECPSCGRVWLLPATPTHEWLCALCKVAGPCRPGTMGGCVDVIAALEMHYTRPQFSGVGRRSWT